MTFLQRMSSVIFPCWIFLQTATQEDLFFFLANWFKTCQCAKKFLFESVLSRHFGNDSPKPVIFPKQQIQLIQDTRPKFLEGCVGGFIGGGGVSKPLGWNREETLCMFADVFVPLQIDRVQRPHWGCLQWPKRMLFRDFHLCRPCFQEVESKWLAAGRKQAHIDRHTENASVIHVHARHHSRKMVQLSCVFFSYISLHNARKKQTIWQETVNKNAHLDANGSEKNGSPLFVRRESYWRPPSTLAPKIFVLLLPKAVLDGIIFWCYETLHQLWHLIKLILDKVAYYNSQHFCSTMVKLLHKKQRKAYLTGLLVVFGLVWFPFQGKYLLSVNFKLFAWKHPHWSSGAGGKGGAEGFRSFCLIGKVFSNSCTHLNDNVDVLKGGNRTIEPHPGCWTSILSGNCRILHLYIQLWAAASQKVSG